MSAWGDVREELRSIASRDPAARSSFQIAFCYAGLHAVWIHRLSHRLWQRDHTLVARMLSSIARAMTGVEIHPGASIGARFFIDHGSGVVIGETTQIGSDVTIYQGVTLGGTSLSRGKRHPTLGDRVTVGAGAKVLGPIHLGDDCRIGANSVVVRDVPANTVVVGVPGQVIERSRLIGDRSEGDRDDSLSPDLVGTSLQTIFHRLDNLERRLSGSTHDVSDVRPSKDGTWRGEDFSI